MPHATEPTPPAVAGAGGAVVAWTRRLVGRPAFNAGIVAVILANAVVIGLDTSPYLGSRFGGFFAFANNLCLGIFIAEAALKITAAHPRPLRYFRVGWNVFDFAVIVVGLLPATRELATVARLARLLRVLRLVSALPRLRLIVSTLVRSVPSMLNVVALMSIIFYIYGVAGYHLFRDADPTHWRTLGISMLTLFRIVTLEDWTDVMYNAMAQHWWAWAYFVSFVVLGTFVVVNLFIAVVIDNLAEAKAERLEELVSAPSQEELLAELRTTQATLARLEQRLRDGEGAGTAAMPGSGR